MPYFSTSGACQFSDSDRGEVPGRTVWTASTAGPQVRERRSVSRPWYNRALVNLASWTPRRLLHGSKQLIRVFSREGEGNVTRALLSEVTISFHCRSSL